MAIKHTFQSEIADDPTAEAAGEVTPTRWNDDHTIDDGTLSIAKTNGLQAALDDKQPTLPNFTAGQVLFGDGDNVPSTSSDLTFDDTTKALVVGGKVAVGGGNTSPLAMLDLRADGATDKALTLRMAAGQTANPFELQNSAGSILSSYDKDGNLRLNSFADQKIYGFNNSTHINMYNSSTGGIDLYCLNGTSSAKIFGALVTTGGINCGGSFSMNGNLNVGAGNYLAADPSNYNRIYPYDSSNANMRFVVGHPAVGNFIWEYPSGTAVMTLTRGGNLGIGTTIPTARVDIAGSTTAKASLRFRSGVAPTSPNDGDVWYDGTDLKIRIGGTTKTFTLL